MRTDRLPLILLALAVALPSALHAQAARNTKEAITNEAQIIAGRNQLARDQREVREFESLLAELDAARAAGSKEAYNKLYAQLRTRMQLEIEQAQKKSAQSSREVRQSRRELRGEVQEARTTDAPVDKLQAAGDRHDLRDDRRDFRSISWRAKRMSAIVAQANALQPGIDEGDAGAMTRGHRLMGEFLELLRADLRATAVEVGEDRGERREDRRERNTDSKQ